MNEVTDAIEGLADAIKEVSLARIEDGYILDTPLEQVQDALDIIKFELEQEEPEPIPPPEPIEIRKFTLIKNEEL